jgi:replicative DNA helicase
MAEALVTPHDLEAEQAVLGAILVDNDRLDDIREQLAPGDFFRGAHRTLFAAMQRLGEQRRPIDPVTLPSALAPEVFEDAGGPAYVFKLVDGVHQRQVLRGDREGLRDPATRD